MTCYVLDTDHLSLFERGHPQVSDRIDEIEQSASDEVVITVVSLEEQHSGRLAQIRKANSTETLVEAYERLKRTAIFLADLSALDYTAEADQLFREFRSAGIRIGTQDLRIASIVLAHDGILLTRNLRDFEKVPGLRIQDWSL